jgi:hypothetical protein
MSQLSLFTKRAAKKPPPAIERRTHIAIADTLRVGLASGWLWFHPANGELRQLRTAELLKRMGVRPGVSDFILVGPPQGRVHALEVKRKGNRPTEAQIAFLEAVRAAGGLSDWVDTFEAAIGLLREWGALSDRVRF